MIADQYLQTINDCLSTVVHSDTVDRRYEFIKKSIVGQSVAQTASCWLKYPQIVRGKKYHTVLATDEFFTYNASADQQQHSIETVIAATQQRLIITVRDFKNSHRHELCNHYVIQQDQHTLLINETARSSSEDRQAWDHDAYLIFHPQNQPVTVQHVGTVQRRAVYFKQLAKFCFDASCKSFQVLPNVLFKPILKNHVEHVIVVDW